jgi:hypothetical protein
MKKNVYLVIALLLIAISVIWNNLTPKDVKAYYHLLEWGIFLLPVPIGYCLAYFFSSSSTWNSGKVLLYISLGCFFSILLSRNLAESFWLQKIVLVSISALLIWVFTRKFDSVKG